MVQKEQIQGYAARLLMVSFFLPMQWQVLVLLACMLVFLVLGEKGGFTLNREKAFQVLILAGGLLLCVAGLLMTQPGYRKIAGGICERKLSLLAIPLLLALISPECRKIILREQGYFVFGAAALIAIANIRVMWHFGMWSGTRSPVNHVDYRQYLEWVTGIHPTYLGMYLCFALCLILCNTGNLAQLPGYLKNGLFYFLLLCLLALLAKSPMAALVLIMIHSGWVNRHKLASLKYHFAGGLALLIGAYMFVPFFGQRLGEMVHIGRSGGAAEVHANSINERKLILHTDMSVLKTYWITGTGPGKLQQVLNAHYLMYSIHNDVNTGFYDPHSEYLWQWLTFGIVGILVFVSLLVYLIYHSIRRNDRMFMYLMTLVVITFFTESVLARQHGVVFFALFAGLYLFGTERKSKGII